MGEINETEVRVRFHEVDQMRIVHHSVYYVWLEVARFEFASRVFGCSPDELTDNDVALPVVEAYCRYLRPARFGDVVRVETFVEIGDTPMLCLYYRLFRVPDLVMLAEARTRHAFTRPGGGLLLGAPAFLAARIEKAREKHPECFIAKPAHIDNRRTDQGQESAEIGGGIRWTSPL